MLRRPTSSPCVQASVSTFAFRVKCSQRWTPFCKALLTKTSLTII